VGGTDHALVIHISDTAGDGSDNPIAFERHDRTAQLVMSLLGEVQLQAIIPSKDAGMYGGQRPNRFG
jgi:hypothetical protein